MLSVLSYDTLWWILICLYIPACFGLIVVVLLQKGKGTGFAGAFGIGPGSEAVFGPRASKSLPVRLTYIMAGMFLTLAFALSLLSGRLGKGIAPEKMELTAETNQTSGLQDLGLGTETVKGDESLFVTPSESGPAMPSPEAPAAGGEASKAAGAAPSAPSEPAAPTGAPAAAPEETTPPSDGNAGGQ